MAQQKAPPGGRASRIRIRIRKMVEGPDRLVDTEIGSTMLGVPNKVSDENRGQEVFRSYVYRQQRGVYVAECVDLDLMVKAQNAKRAARELADAVRGYVAVARESGCAAELLPRRAPWSHRVRYQFLRVAAGLSLLRDVAVFDCGIEAETR